MVLSQLQNSGDVLISRPKVLRNAYVTKEIDFNTYLYGSVFTLEECEKIKHGLEVSLCLKRTEK